MTISSTTNRVSYSGNGVTTAFAFPYLFLANADLKVYKNDVLQTVTTHYTVAGVLNPAGGTVTFLSAPGSSDDVVILRDPAIVQPIDLVENDPLPAETTERGFDRLTMIAQRLSDRLDRAVTAPDYDITGVPLSLPAAAVRANNFLGFDSTGAPVPISGFPSSATTLGSVNSVAALRLVSGTVHGQTIDVSGYYAAADGGGGPRRVWSATSTATDNGGSIVKPTAIAAPDPGRWLWDWIGPEMPEWYGAKGDNVTNDYAAIFAMAASGQTIQGDLSKTYKVNSALAFTGYDNLTLRDLVLNMVGVANGADLLTVQGSTSATTTTLTVAGTKTLRAMTVVSSTGFAVGDMVAITSTEDFSGTDANYLKGELGFIASISGGTNITLRDGLKDSYSITGETVTVTKLNKIVNPVIDNVTVTGNGVGATHIGIRVNYAVNPVVRRPKVSACEVTGIDFAYCENGVIEEGNGTGANTLLTGYAYSFSFLTQNSRIVKCRATDFRHGFTTGSYYPVWNFTVHDNTFAHSVGAANAGAGILTHLNGIGGTVTENTVDDCAYGIYMNNPRNIVSKNRVYNAYASCYSLGPDATRETQIHGNFGRGVRGIESGAFAGAIGSASVSIRGNTLIAETVNGVAADYGLNVTTDNADVSENKVDGFPTSVYTPVGTAIRVFDNDLMNYTTPINDAGTFNIFEDNYLNGVKQVYGVLAATAAGFGAYGGAPNANGKAGIQNTAYYALNGKFIKQFLVDDKFNLTAVTTAAGEYRKVLLCLDDGYVGRIVVGAISAVDQESAKIPPHPYNYTPIAVVEIEPSYAGGSLAANVFHQLVGIH